MDSTNRTLEPALGSLRPVLPPPKDFTDGQPQFQGVWGPAENPTDDGPWLLHRPNGSYSYRGPSGRRDEGLYQVVGKTAYYYPLSGLHEGSPQYFPWEMQGDRLIDGVLDLKKYPERQDIPRS